MKTTHQERDTCALQVTEDMMRCMMTVIASGLRTKVSCSFRQAVHVIIMQLVTRVSLNANAITGESCPSEASRHGIG